MSDAPSDLLVIRQSREKLAWLLVIALGFLILGEIMFLRPEISSRHSREYVQIVGALSAVLGLCSAVSVVAQLVWPATLELRPDGLTYKGPWWRRTWAWSDVGEFVIERRHQVSFIFFEAPALGWRKVFGWSDARRQALPGRWVETIVKVRDALNDARVRWR